MIDDKAGSAQTETPARVLQPEGSAKRHTTVRLGVIAAVLAAAMSLAPAAMAAPADDRELCKSGGYAGYTDLATGARFANQGQCVSYVNEGGLLTTVLVDLGPSEYGEDSVAITVTGLSPNARVGGRVTGGDGVRSVWRPAGQFADANGSNTVHLNYSVGPCERFPLTFEVYDAATGLFVPGDESFIPARCQV